MTRIAPAAEETFDVVLIGAGIMSTTLGAVLSRLEPEWSVGLFEGLDRAGRESSDPWNNAGTGHAALCELNYTPQDAAGEVSPVKAVAINEQFHISRQLWAHWVREGVLGAPQTFIHGLSHLSFVWGEKNAEYLRRRHEALVREPVFSSLEHTEDSETIEGWAPLLMRDRESRQKVAASRAAGGTDVDFGAMTQQLAASLGSSGAEIRYSHRITRLERRSDGRWRLHVRNGTTGERSTVAARYVFAGAGGGTLPLLQSAGLPEVRGYAGFPVAGQFLRTTDAAVAQEHHAKVYGLAGPGAPPMSVPHLDTRFVEGGRTLMFGPYAGFTTRFLKHGRLSDLPGSLRRDNLLPMLQVAKDRRDFVTFLLKELVKDQRRKTIQLFDYYPGADPHNWELLTAGQRVQIIKPGPAAEGQKGRGLIQLFGTELIVSEDRSLMGLLGASPGASTAPEIALRALMESFPESRARWEPKLREMVPSYGRELNREPRLLEEVTAATSRTLALD